MNRRDFLNWFGLLGLSTSLPFAMAACSKSTEAEQAASVQEVKNATPAPTLGNSPRPDGYTPISSLTALKASLSGVVSPSEVAVVLVKDAANPDMPKAVSPRCTHTGCTVEWHKATNSFICPCHNAEFDAQGAVKRGPAEKPLPTYAVKVEADTILVKLA
jgi:cytochrome b6-f complex iron-sulfur subunit